MDNNNNINNNTTSRPLPSRLARNSQVFSSTSTPNLPINEDNNNNSSNNGIREGHRSIRIPNSNRHSMALRDGFNINTYSYDSDSFSSQQQPSQQPQQPQQQQQQGGGDENSELKKIAGLAIAREDRNNNKLFRNNMKNNLPNITIPNSNNNNTYNNSNNSNNGEDSASMMRRSPSISHHPRITPIPISPSSPSSQSSSSSPSSISPPHIIHTTPAPSSLYTQGNRHTPTPQSPPSPLMLSPPLSSSTTTSRHSPTHALTSTHASTSNPFLPADKPIPSVNPLSVTMGKFAADLKNDNHSARVPGSVLSSRSGFGGGGVVGIIPATRSEGHIDLSPQPITPTRGVTKDMLQSYKNAPIRPSTAINIPTGGLSSHSAHKHLSRSVLSSSSDAIVQLHDGSGATTNLKRNSSDSFTKTHRRYDSSPSANTPRSVMHNVELEFSEVSYNFDDYEAVDLFTDRVVDAKEAMAIAEKLKTNKTVRKLVVKSQMIEYKGALAFADLISCNTTIQDLSLRSDSEVFTYMDARKDITPKGSGAIARALWDNTTITRFDFSNNYIGDETAKHFADVLIKNCTLTHLDLSDCNISTNSQYLYAALTRNVSLKTLICQRNTLPESAMEVLCNSLKHNQTLTCLDLDESRQPIPANPFLAALQFNYSLCELKLGITDNKKLSQLEQKLQRNRKIQEAKYNFRGDVPRPPSPELLVPTPAYETRPSRSASLLKYIPPLPFGEPKKSTKKEGSERSLRRSAPNTVTNTKASLTPIPSHASQPPIPASALQHSLSTSLPHNATIPKLPAIVSQDFIDRLKIDVARLDLSNLKASHSVINEILDRIYQSKRDYEDIKELYLNKNQLVDLPSKVTTFYGISVLVFSQNLLRSLDPDIVMCRHLVTLNISHNQLRDLPGSFAKLYSLHNLDVSFNKFQLFPVEICNLTSLQTLFINKNEISTIPPQVGQLQALTHVDISCNNLAAIPPEMCKLKSLLVLQAQCNQIAMLPREIPKLQLRELTLDCNRLEYLPTEMSKLLVSQFLAVVGLKQNPLSTIPKKEDRIDATALSDALQNVEKESQWMNTVKLILCGDGNVGKTTLLKSFMNDGSTCGFGENIATDGIDFQKWTVKQKGRPINFKTLDFAGQPLYYHTHQFFVSSDTAYIVAFNLAHENLSRVEYWLHTLAVIAKDCPIIVVGTNSDDKKCTKAYTKGVIDSMRKSYSEKFPTIVDYVVVSNKTGKGIKELMHLLAKVAENWKLAGYTVPSNYVLIGRRLQAIKTQKSKSESPTMTLEEFEKLVVEFNIPHDQTAQVLHSLNRIGEIVYLGDKEKNSALADIIFLDCKWLADVMSSVISLKTRIKDGILNDMTIKQMWRPFAPNLHGALIKLLEKFEIMYAMPTTLYREGIRTEIAENESKYLVPSFLPVDRPAALQEIWPVVVENVPQLSRCFEFHFLPVGFFSRLIIRLSVLFQPTFYWQDGMMIRVGDFSQLYRIIATPEAKEDRALLEYNPLRFTLNVHVRGARASKLMTTLADNIDILVSGWFPGQLACVRIPCVHCVRAHSFDPYMFTLAECQRAAALGGQYVHCRGIKPVRIDQLAGDATLSGLEHLQIDFDTIEIKREVGKGSFARVFEGIYKNEIVAVKKIELFGPELSAKMSKSAAKEELEEETMEKFAEFRREALLMSGVKHPNLVQLKGICYTPFCMVTEFLPHGDLFHFLQKKENAMSWKLRFKIALDIANGLKFLHSSSPPIIHRDLKSPNVLLCGIDEMQPVCAKIADFGLSIRAGSDVKKREVHNACWLAPEIMREQQYTEKVDVYSFGIVLWELYTRQNPFDEFRHMYKFNSQLEAVIITGLRPTIPTTCPQVYSRLIEECWNDDPGKRPSFEQIVTKILQIQSVIDPASHKASFLAKEITRKNSIRRSIELVSAPQDLPLGKSGTIGRGRGSLSNPNAPKIVEEVSERLSSYSGVHCMEVVENTVWCGCMDGSIEIWHKYARSQIVKIQAHAEDVWCLKLIGSVVWSCSQDMTISIWDKNLYKENNYKPMRTLKQKDIVVCLEPAGKRVWSGSSLGDIRVFNKKDFKCVRDLKVEGAVGCMLFLPPNKMWIGTDKLIVILDTNSTSCVTLVGHSRMVHSLVRVDSTVWSCSSDKTIRVWSEQGEALREISGHSGRVFGLLNVGDVNVWSSSWDASIIIWDAKTYSFLQELKGLHNDAVSALVAVEKDTKVDCVWSASWDKSIGCWKYKAPPHIAIRNVIIDRSGYMMKQGGEIKTWKNRYFVLSKGILSYYEKNTDDEPIHSVNIRGCPLHDDVQEIGGKKFCFSIESFEPRKNIDKRVFIMSCETQADKEAWLDAMRVYCSND